MNVIIANKNQLLLENLGIDVIKEMNGEFDVDEIIATFQNFFYQRMILDITAIKNYTDISNLKWMYAIGGKITSMQYTDNDVVCEDADGDGYYFWGVGEKPVYCP